MKALSIKQPFAWLVAAGYKPVENRSWQTSHRGKLLIHASAKPALSPADMRLFRVAMSKTGIRVPLNLQYGGIIGSVELINCVTECDDPNDADWHEPGNFAWILKNAELLPFAEIPGKQRLFDVPDSLINF